MKQDANKFIAYLAIIATPFALGAFVLAWSPAQQFSNEDPAGDGYVPPRSIERLVERTQESTLNVRCEPTSTNIGGGTAWAIELTTEVSDQYPTTLITNHHVIEDCIGIDGSVTVNLPYQEKIMAVIVKWDEENDLDEGKKVAAKKPHQVRLYCIELIDCCIGITRHVLYLTHLTLFSDGVKQRREV